MKLALTITEFVILALAMQSQVMAVVLLYTSKKLSSNRWIAAIIFCVSVIATIRVVFDGMHLQDKYPWLTPLIYHPAMLVGPFIYLYARALLYGDKKLHKRQWLHFLAGIKGSGPQIAFLLFHSGLLFLGFVQDIFFTKAAQFILFDVHIISNLPTLLSLVIYGVLSYRLVKQSQREETASVYKVKDIAWLKNLLRLFAGLTALYLVSIIINFRPLIYKADMVNAVFFIPLSGFTYWLSISTYIRQSKMSAEDVVIYNKAPVKVYFSDDDAGSYQKKLLELMEKEHLYLDPLLKMDTLAARLKITERAISNLLNQHLGKSFNDFVNEYRVEAAKVKLADPAFDQYTIAAIAYECGFNSLATFQRCFKQHCGITPSRYLQQRKATTQLINQQ